MRRFAIAACAIGATVSGAFAAAGVASGASTICVGARAGCYATIQPAVDAAHDGDTIVIARGTYVGGVTVDSSVTIVGAGAGSTIVKGGGPVLEIGLHGAATQPTVSITGVTITGGVTTSAPTPDGPITFAAVGGGVNIEGPASPTSVGAVVTIKNSVITGNRATPTSVDTSGPQPFAAGSGGGIADVGQLTLINTTVSDNLAGGSFASHAGGGGIWTATGGGPGSLTLINSTVTGNTASVTAPNGEFVSGGGIEVQDGEAFTVTNSVISANTASATSTYPSSVGVFADSGGIHVGGFGTATITGSRITGNVAAANDPAGAPGAGDAALAVGLSDFCVCGQTLVLKDTVLSGNRTTVVGGDGSFSGTTMEIDSPATVTNLAVTDNTISGTSQAGAITALGAVFTFDGFDGESRPVVMRQSVISGNTVRASSGTGPVTLQGAGLTNGGLLELHGVLLTGNTGIANGTSGVAQGGGIWNGQPFGPDGSPTPTLLVDHSAVLGNALRASPGLTVQGGGLFTTGFTASLANSLIARNTPDQCVGC